MRRLPLLDERTYADAKVLQVQGGLGFRDELDRAGAHVTCKIGCSACCYHPFLINLLEGVLLYQWLAEHGKWTPELRKRCEVAREQTRDLTYDVWKLAKLSCVLLTSGDRCMAYEGRPFRCRVIHSVGDPAQCDVHRLGPMTPLVNHVVADIEYSKGCQALIRRLGGYGVMMPLADAVLLGEGLMAGKLDLRDAELRYVRGPRHA